MRLLFTLEKKVVHRKTGMSLTIVFNFQSLNFKGAIDGIAENVTGSIHTITITQKLTVNSKTVFSAQ